MTLNSVELCTTNNNYTKHQLSNWAESTLVTGSYYRNLRVYKYKQDGGEIALCPHCVVFSTESRGVKSDCDNNSGSRSSCSNGSSVNSEGDKNSSSSSNSCCSNGNVKSNLRDGGKSNSYSGSGVVGGSGSNSDGSNRESGHNSTTKNKTSFAGAVTSKELFVLSLEDKASKLANAAKFRKMNGRKAELSPPELLAAIAR
ncbi:Hypothetical predicted protein [Octopus vulgaris]|uniref:Uncharacterized protein n=1 Tax=Octopus vulgaris TaxID=6645 RepID=A0AA36BIQ1_OCTVU|nr:Hypothetical predicted protein [Octopus vulgaris]